MSKLKLLKDRFKDCCWKLSLYSISDFCYWKIEFHKSVPLCSFMNNVEIPRQARPCAALASLTNARRLWGLHVVKKILTEWKCWRLWVKETDRKTEQWQRKGGGGGGRGKVRTEGRKLVWGWPHSRTSATTTRMPYDVFVLVVRRFQAPKQRQTKLKPTQEGQELRTGL